MHKPTKPTKSPKPPYEKYLKTIKHPFPILYIDRLNNTHIYNRDNIQFGIVSNIGSDNLPLEQQEHILLLDYDNLPLSDVEKEITRIIDYYELGPCYILKSNKHKHYHVISFTPITFSTYTRILDDTSCCEQYRKFTKSVKHGTLRITPKTDPIYLIRTIPSPNNTREHLPIKESYFKILALETRKQTKNGGKQANE